jgi:hypothetical protein
MMILTNKLDEPNQTSSEVVNTSWNVNIEILFLKISPLTLRCLGSLSSGLPYLFEHCKHFHALKL